MLRLYENSPKKFQGGVVSGTIASVKSADYETETEWQKDFGRWVFHPDSAEPKYDNNCGFDTPTEVGGVSVALRNKQIIYGRVASPSSGKCNAYPARKTP